MITSATQDSDNEFEYDFTADDEELLIHLASNNPGFAANNVPRSSTPPRPAIVAIDTVPERVSGRSQDNDELFQKGFRHDRVGGRSGPIELINGGDAVPSATVRESDGSRTLPSPVSLDDDNVMYPNLSQALRALDTEAVPPHAEAADNDNGDDDDEGQDDPYDDDRSPLQRFRGYPRKPLTVSDLTSGAWCELQYWYTLTRLPGGRRTRTQAMKQGSKVHRKLEEEVHTTVKIEILNKEDGFGLRLWNLVQGLRTLRDTGLTRELEVWGMVDGNLVNGVIDRLSYENPNPEFEEDLLNKGALQQRSRHHQKAVTDYFPSNNSNTAAVGSSYTPKIYLADVKTRGTLAPASSALLRPAKIQLLLYHRFLSDMAAGKLDFFKVFRRYGLDADERFSDTFMCQIGDLHDEVFFDTPTSSDEQRLQQMASNNESQDTNPITSQPQAPSSSSSSPLSTAPDLLKYGSLRQLLALVESEIRLTFPLGAASLGHILSVQYVFRDDGRELDAHDFPVSQQDLDTYLSTYMGWWRGERKADGVTIEEAFKCGTCEFAESCKWRRGMDEERVRRVRDRVAAAREGGIRW